MYEYQQRACDTTHLETLIKKLTTMYFQEKGEVAKLLCEDWQGDKCEEGDWQCPFHWNGELGDDDDNDVDDDDHADYESDDADDDEARGGSSGILPLMCRGKPEENRVAPAESHCRGGGLAVTPAFKPEASGS